MQYIHHSENRQVLSVLLIFAAIRLILAVIIPAGFDEAYYYIYGRNLAWGYFDHPPMVGLIAFLSRILSPLNGWNLEIRIFPILLFTLTGYLLYCTIRRFSSQRSAIFTLILFNVTPYFSLGAGAFLFPDNALLFFWLLFLSAIIRLDDSFHWSMVFAAGVSGGLALLSKYHGVLLIPALFSLPFLLPKWRTKQYLLSLPVIVIVMLIVFSPNIFWNASHEWVSYFYQFGKGSAKNADFSLLKLGQAIAVQAAYLSPWIFILLIWAILKSIKHAQSFDKLLLPFVLIPVLAFTLIGTTRSILPHWPMPGYLGAFLLTAIWLEKWKGKSVIYWASGSSAAMLLLVMLLIIQARFGLLPLPVQNDPTLDGYGWDKLATKLKSGPGYHSQNHFYFTNRWFLSGQLGYALFDENDVTVLNSKAPHGFAFWSDPQKYQGQTGIFISSSRFKANPAAEFGAYFDSIMLIDSLDVYRNNQKAKQFKIWNCTNFNGRFPSPYTAGIHK